MKALDPRQACRLLLWLLPITGCGTAGDIPTARTEATPIPAARTLVRDGLLSSGEQLLTIDDSAVRCHAPELWRRHGSSWTRAWAGPSLPSPPCPAVTVRLAPDQVTLAVYDYGRGRASLVKVGGAASTTGQGLELGGRVGFDFPLPGPNLAFSKDGAKLLLGTTNRRCRADADGLACGAAELIARTARGWESQAVLEPDGETRREVWFGQAVALSGDGELALVGGTGRPGQAGGLWLFALGPGPARDLGELRPDRRDPWFAIDLAFARDGGWLAVGGERAAYLYRREGPSFVLAQRLTPPGPEAGHFGERLALSADGRMLLVGAPRTRCATGPRCGAAYLYRRHSGWQLHSVIGAADDQPGVDFAHQVALSPDGRHLAIQGRTVELLSIP